MVWFFNTGENNPPLLSELSILTDLSNNNDNATYKFKTLNVLEMFYVLTLVVICWNSAVYTKEGKFHFYV